MSPLMRTVRLPPAQVCWDDGSFTSKASTAERDYRGLVMPGYGLRQAEDAQESGWIKQRSMLCGNIAT